MTAASSRTYDLIGRILTEIQIRFTLREKDML